MVYEIVRYLFCQLIDENTRTRQREPYEKKKKKKKRTARLPMGNPVFVQNNGNSFPPIVRKLGIRCEFTQQTTANVCVFWIN